jgi:hypothetical protein
VLAIWKADHISRCHSDNDQDVAQAPVSPTCQMISYLKQHHEHILVDDSIMFPEFSKDRIDVENEQYFTYLPYEGMSNQYYCLIRGLFVAKKLNRTLLIPPLLNSKHDSLKNASLDWRLLVNFTAIDENPNIFCKYKFINPGMIGDLRKLFRAHGSRCFTYGRWKHLFVLGNPANDFIKRFKLQKSARLDWNEFPNPEHRDALHMIDLLNNRTRTNLLCAANLVHLRFGNKVEIYWKLIQPSDYVMKTAVSYLGSTGLIGKRYAAIHWRRGDFSWACDNKIKEHCWPTVNDLKAHISRINIRTGIEAFLIGTNDPDFHLDMIDDGIDILQIKMPLQSHASIEWVNLAAVSVDIFLFLHADYFIGNRYSSISNSVVIRRGCMGLKNTTETF